MHGCQLPEGGLHWPARSTSLRLRNLAPKILGRRGSMQVELLTHRGKHPTMRGDLPRFDFYDGLREILIFAKRKDIHNERVPVPVPVPYEMGCKSVVSD